MDKSRGLLLVCLFLFSALITSPAFAVTVQPGQPNKIEVKVPPSCQAGVRFSVQLTVLDSEGNIVDDYAELDREIVLETNGSGELSRRTVSSEQFEEGRVTLSLSYNLAEKIRIRAAEQQHVASGRSESVIVRPGPPTKFVLNTPDTVRAGANFSLDGKVVDAHGNRVTRYKDMTNGLLLRSTGMSRPVPEFLPDRKIREGRFHVSVSYRVAEKIKIVVEDEVNGLKTVSDPVRVVPGGLAELSVSTPDEVTAGESFRTAVEARDKYGNIIDNYSEVGGGVELLTSGSGQLDPTYIPPGDFSDGVAFTQLTYDEAETFRIKVADRNSPVSGSSPRLRCQAGKLSDFKIEVPGEASAGKEFNVQLTAVDAYGNRIRQFSQPGDSLALYVRNQPEKQVSVSKTAFEKGQATVQFDYKTARDLRLIAEGADGEISKTSESIRITPGPPGSIDIDVASRVKAGEKFPVSFTLTDQFGNQIKNSTNLAGELQAGLVNGQNSQLKTFGPDEFVDGRHQLQFFREQADTVIVFVEYREFDIRARSRTVEVLPAEFDHVAVRTPGQVRVGENFEVAVQLQDLYGNPLREVPSDLTPLRILTTGSGEVEPRKITEDMLEVPAFTVELKYYVAEGMALRVVNQNRKELGVSAPISVQPGKLASFSMATPAEVNADQPFPVRIEAEDQFGNLIKDLNKREGRVQISNSGGTELEEKKLFFRDFVNGTTESSVQYRQAGPLRLQATGDGVSSVSDTIYVQPGAPDSYQVEAPRRVEAGEPFSARVTVYDQFGNRVQNLPSDFNGVRLRTEGRERVSPRKISAALFENGRADLYLIYPRTGEISLSAGTFGRPLEGPVVERIYISRKPDSALLYAVFTGRPEVTVRESDQSPQVDVVFQPAILPTDSSYRTYYDWFIKKIAQRQVGSLPLPKVLLQVFPRNELKVEKSLENNLFTLKLNTVRADLPTLKNIQNLIEEEQFDEAREKLQRYLEENPDNSYANRLRHRLERLEEVINQ